MRPGRSDRAGSARTEHRRASRPAGTAPPRTGHHARPNTHPFQNRAHRLAERIEYSRPVLYSHFRGKREIIGAVALEGAAEAAASLRAAAAADGPRGRATALAAPTSREAMESFAAEEMATWPSDEAIAFATRLERLTQSLAQGETDRSR